MKDVFASVRVLFWMTLLTGLAYPLGITAVAHLAFRDQAHGSLLRDRGQVIGSKWIGQAFFDPAYFHPRPSATSYNPLPSAGSNLSVTHRDFPKFVANVPPDLLYASGSGLDPHVSPEAARFQVGRVAAARRGSGATPEKLGALVDSIVEPPDFGVLGQPRVNVLLLNLELDRQFPRRGP